MNFDSPAALSALAKGDLANAVVAATPGGIEAQEAAGQRALVSNFTRLPKEYGWQKPFPKELLERLGFTIGADEDELFVSVTPPAGWSMRATDHSMHSDIVDDKGHKRGSVFYKAAFYDRKANFYFDCRYQIATDYGERSTGRFMVRQMVKDFLTGAWLSESDWYNLSEDRGGVIETQQMEACKAWLAANFPDHQSVDAYWS